MLGVKVGRTTCHRWALDLINTEETSRGMMVYRLEAVCLLGGRCTYPGCSVTKHYMLTIAHRNGDGGEHRKQYATGYTASTGGGLVARAGTTYYQDILGDIREGRGDRYILLCENHHRELDWMARREKRLAKRSALRSGIRAN